MRLFIAIELPDELKKALVRLRVDIPGARWLPLEQIHLTLAFLGEVEEVTVLRLISELARIKKPAFELSCAGTGCFPVRHRPRVLWVGLEPEPRLYDLANSVRDAVSACGIYQEERHFSPHITLARLKLLPSKEFELFMDQPTKPLSRPFTVSGFTLFQSRLTRDGAMHLPLESFPLLTRGADWDFHQC